VEVGQMSRAMHAHNSFLENLISCKQIYVPNFEVESTTVIFGVDIEK
jgi:hypothetical protein